MTTTTTYRFKHIEGGVPQELLPYIKKVLSLYGKDMRCIPMIKLLKNALSKAPEEAIQKSLVIYEKKCLETNEKIHPNYFVKVLEGQSLSHNHNSKTEVINWGKDI